MEPLPIETIREKALDELTGSGRSHDASELVCRYAQREMREKPPVRPYSRLFYELAFFYREEKCLTTAYRIWFPVMRSWIVRWDMDLLQEHLDDVVDELIYSTFDALFRAIVKSRFTDFEAGKIHNFFKKTLQLKVFNRYRREKRNIVSRLNSRRRLLNDEHIRTLRERIQPRFEKVRSPLESRLFNDYLLEGKSIKQFSRSETWIRNLGEVRDPVKVLHNRVHTVLWNTYKILKRYEASDKEYRVLLREWLG